MKRILLFSVLPLCGFAASDVVMLKDGRQVSGTIESGTTREIRIMTGDHSEVFAVDQIQSIAFDSPGAPAPSQPQPTTLTTRLAERPVQNEPQGLTLPAGTEIAIRTISRIDSRTADLNKEYEASLDEALTLNGVELLPARTNAVLRVTELKHPKLKGRDSLSLSLIALTVDGRRIEVKTGSLDSQSGSHATRDVLVGAAGGAAVGAAVGGGVGAAAGAAIGGVGGKVFDRVREKVEIAPETRFTYRLAEPVVINRQDGAR